MEVREYIKVQQKYSTWLFCGYMAYISPIVIIFRGMILLFLVLSMVLQLIQGQGIYSNVLDKYFQKDHQSHFFVSVGFIEELCEAMENQFRDWQSLYLLQDRSKAVHPYLASEQTTLLYASTQNETKDSLSLNLAQLCTKYYLKPPKILLLSARDHLLSLLKTNQWSNNLCLPEVILLQSHDMLIKDYLLDVGYSLQGINEELFEFTLGTEIEDALQIAKVPKVLPPFISVEKLKEIGRKFIGNQAIYIRSMNDRYLLVEDVIASLPKEEESAYIFISNFNISTDSIVIGHSYGLLFVDFEGFYFIKIEFYNDRGEIVYLYLHVEEKHQGEVRIIGLQGQRLCKLSFPKKDDIQTPKQNKSVEMLQEKKEQQLKQEIPQESTIIYWIILIIFALFLLFSIRFFLTKARPNRSIKQQYTTIRTHQISIIQQEPQEHPSIT